MQEQLPKDAVALSCDFRCSFTPMCLIYLMAAPASRAPCRQPKLTFFRIDYRASLQLFIPNFNVGTIAQIAPVAQILIEPVAALQFGADSLLNIVIHAGRVTGRHLG